MGSGEIRSDQIGRMEERESVCVCYCNAYRFIDSIKYTVSTGQERGGGSTIIRYDVRKERRKGKGKAHMYCSKLSADSGH